MDPVRAAPVRILLSDAAATHLAAKLPVALPGVATVIVSLERLAASGGGADFDVAFLSRDITGNSTKTDLKPPLLGFYGAIRVAPALQWLHASSSGVDRPIYGEMLAKGVRVTTSRGATSPVVAHSAMAGLLSLARRLPRLAEAQSRRDWKPLHETGAPPDLRSQTALVVGLGAIGAEIARLLKAFGLRVIGARRSVSSGGSGDPAGDPAPDCDLVISYAQLHAHLPAADWLILAAPLSALTHHIVDGAALALLPDGAGIINVARGELIAQDDLIAALATGRFCGAALDVFAPEPLAADSPLWAMPNVIVMPHSAGHFSGLYEAVAQIFLENLGRWHRGQPLVNEVFG